MRHQPPSTVDAQNPDADIQFITETIDRRKGIHPNAFLTSAELLENYQLNKMPGKTKRKRLGNRARELENPLPIQLDDSLIHSDDGIPTYLSNPYVSGRPWSSHINYEKIKQEYTEAHGGSPVDRDYMSSRQNPAIVEIPDSFPDMVDVGKKIKIVRHVDDLLYKSNNENVKVINVCSGTADADVFLYCTSKTQEPCVIPMHKKVLQKNVPYIEAIYRGTSNWREATAPKPVVEPVPCLQATPSNDVVNDPDVPSTSKGVTMEDKVEQTEPSDEPAAEDEKEVVEKSCSELPGDVFCPELAKYYSAEVLEFYFRTIYSGEALFDSIPILECVQLYRLTSYLSDIKLESPLKQYLIDNINSSILPDLWSSHELDFRPVIMRYLEDLCDRSSNDIYTNNQDAAKITKFVEEVMENPDNTGLQIGEFVNATMNVIGYRHLLHEMETYVMVQNFREVKEMILAVKFTDFDVSNGIRSIPTQRPREKIGEKCELFQTIVERFKRESTEEGLIKLHEHVFKPVIL